MRSPKIPSMNAHRWTPTAASQSPADTKIDQTYYRWGDQLIDSPSKMPFIRNVQQPLPPSPPYNRIRLFFNKNRLREKRKERICVAKKKCQSTVNSSAHRCRPFVFNVLVCVCVSYLLLIFHSLSVRSYVSNWRNADKFSEHICNTRIHDIVAHKNLYIFILFLSLQCPHRHTTKKTAFTNTHHTPHLPNGEEHTREREMNKKKSSKNNLALSIFCIFFSRVWHTDSRTHTHTQSHNLVIGCIKVRRFKRFCAAYTAHICSLTQFVPVIYIISRFSCHVFSPPSLSASPPPPSLSLFLDYIDVAVSYLFISMNRIVVAVVVVVHEY